MKLPLPRQQGVISVDVEDYFQVEAFSRVVDRAEWSNYPSRVEANTMRLLDLFDEKGVKATFFILGWVADKHPQIVREIIRRGHEPACHSYWHRLIYCLTPDEFRSDTLQAKNCIEQAGGKKVLGFRAPCFSITTRSPWAIDILADLGFRYDSSIFPIKHEWYGISGAPRKPFQLTTPSGPITEYPMTTFRLPRAPNFPVAGGGYLRLLPFWYTCMGVHRAWQEGVTVVAYIHPWEIDPEQPRMAASLKSRFRHYTNLASTQTRLASLLGMGDFCPFASFAAPTDVPLWHLPTVEEDLVETAVPKFDVARA